MARGSAIPYGIRRRKLHGMSSIGSWLATRSPHYLDSYGVGIGVMTIARHPAEAAYSVEIPSDRLQAVEDLP
jgi:hypothetical protein